ncbi:MAG: hypothetical protein RIS24_1771 [Verrucomicrobiota bacterium]
MPLLDGLDGACPHAFEESNDLSSHPDEMPIP